MIALAHSGDIRPRRKQRKRLGSLAGRFYELCGKFKRRNKFLGVANSTFEVVVPVMWGGPMAGLVFSGRLEACPTSRTPPDRFAVQSYNWHNVKITIANQLK